MRHLPSPARRGDSDYKPLGGAALLRSHKRGACHDVHALALQNAAHALGDLRVIAPQQALATLDESDAAAEVVKQLAKLKADVAAPITIRCSGRDFRFSSEVLVRKSTP